MSNRSVPPGRALRILGPLTLLGLLAASSIVLGGTAQAFTAFAPPLTGGADYVTGFRPCGGIGPIGVLNDGTNFFASDFCTGKAYRFPLSGGALPGIASATNGLTHGLTRANGHYYGISRGVAGTARGLYRFDPATLALGALIAVIPGDARQVAPDPTSPDLFVSSDGGIFRVADPDTSPTVTQLATGNVDGMVFTGDGQHLWAAYIYENRVKRLSRGGALEENILTGHRPDGLAIARDDAPGGVAGNVFANDNDGTILRIDTNNANAVSVVASGGSRGDFATVGPDGCFYVTQSDRIVKLAPCFFQPPPSADLSVVKAAQPAAVLVLGHLTYQLRVRNAGPNRATAVTVTDTLPANVRLVSATSAQGSCSPSGQTVTCTLGALEPDASVDVTIVVGAGLFPETLDNTATVTGTEPDPDPSNNTSSAVAQVTVLPVLPTPPSPTPGPSPTPSPSPSPSVLSTPPILPPQLPRTGPDVAPALLVLLGSCLIGSGAALALGRPVRSARSRG